MTMIHDRRSPKIKKILTGFNNQKARTLNKVRVEEENPCCVLPFRNEANPSQLDTWSITAQANPFKGPGSILLEDGKGKVRPLAAMEVWEMQGGGVPSWEQARLRQLFKRLVGKQPSASCKRSLAKLPDLGFSIRKKY